MDPQTILSLNKASYRLQHLSPSGQAFDKVVVGAIIFHPSTTPPRILFLKRAAHEPAFPNIFELPSGKVEDTDATIFDGLKREVREETGLEIARVHGMVEPMYYTIERRIEDGGEEVEGKRTTVQMNFVCEVEGDGDGFRVNLEEHSEGRWAGESEVGGLDVTAEMRMVLGDAFEWKKAQLRTMGKNAIAS